jgi:hypothetical protein
MAREATQAAGARGRRAAEHGQARLHLLEAGIPRERGEEAAGEELERRVLEIEPLRGNHGKLQLRSSSVGNLGWRVVELGNGGQEHCGA